MIILVFLAACLSISPHLSLLKNTSEFSLQLQQKCLNLLPKNSEHESALRSLVCGEKITDEKLKENLSKTSLIHIFVISGSHLILLDELLSILRIPFVVRFLFLSFYSLATGWQPPAVRAWMAMGLREVFKRKGWHFPADLSALIAGLATLALFPQWWTSLGLLMSWCASLALCWGPLLRVRNPVARLVISQICIFIFMSLPLWGLGNLHPLSLLYNLILGPGISFVLLPLGFLCIPLHFLIPLFDGVMKFFSLILDHFTEPVVKGLATQPSVVVLWIWVFSWHLIYHIVRLRLLQGKDSR